MNRKEICLKIMDGIKRCGVEKGVLLKPSETRTAIVAVAGGSSYSIRSYEKELVVRRFLEKMDGGYYVRRFE